ncbi:hypothetical protein [Actinomycetospora aeridis]|uniref:Uncharacterized protein n=1 Tax=Actinomycetospora aeridis TaxID=3129231 RepID=A0ABU8NB22_9PSEU
MVAATEHDLRRHLDQDSPEGVEDVEVTRVRAIRIRLPPEPPRAGHGAGPGPPGGRRSMLEELDGAIEEAEIVGHRVIGVVLEAARGDEVEQRATECQLRLLVPTLLVGGLELADLRHHRSARVRHTAIMIRCPQV